MSPLLLARHRCSPLAPPDPAPHDPAEAPTECLVFAFRPARARARPAWRKQGTGYQFGAQETWKPLSAAGHPGNPPHSADNIGFGSRPIVRRARAAVKSAGWAR